MVRAGDSAHLRRYMAVKEVGIMRIIVIKLPACLARLIMRLRGGYEPE